MLRLDRLLLAVGASDGHLAGCRETAVPVDPLHLVLAEEELDPLARLAGDVLLELAHPVHVQLHAGGLHSHRGAVLRLLVDVGAVEHGLGGDAPTQGASAAHARVLLDDHRLQAVLARADGAHVAAGTAADDREIVGRHEGLPGAKRGGLVALADCDVNRGAETVRRS